MQMPATLHPPHPPLKPPSQPLRQPSPPSPSPQARPTPRRHISAALVLHHVTTLAALRGDFGSFLAVACRVTVDDLARAAPRPPLLDLAVYVDEGDVPAAAAFVATAVQAARAARASVAHAPLANLTANVYSHADLLVLLAATLPLDSERLSPAPPAGAGPVLTLTATPALPNAELVAPEQAARVHNGLRGGCGMWGRAPPGHFLFQAAPGTQLQSDALRYTARMLGQLGLLSDVAGTAEATLSGISLAPPTHDAAAGVGYAPMATDFRSDPSEPYTLQQPQRWGGFLCLGHAVRFLEWYRWRQPAVGLPAAASPLARLADPRALILAMTELQSTLVYSPPSVSVHLVELPPALTGRLAGAPLPWPALNVPPTPWPWSQLAAMIRAVSVARLPVYNMALTFLHRGAGRLYARDGEIVGSCTLLMTVYDRHEDVRARIVFYHSALCLRAIHIVWNAVGQPVPAGLDGRYFRIPVTLEVQARNSMNNRFRPHPAIATDCVLNMDDDWNMPHQVMFFATRLWHHRFPMRIVGLRNLARLHGRAGAHAKAAGYGGRRQSGIEAVEAADDDDAAAVVAAAGLSADQAADSPSHEAVEDGGNVHVLPLPAQRSWLYLKNNSAPQSLALPSGMVYHRRYMAMYSAPALAPARALVDRLVNCDDLLFNCVVANATGLPPAFLNTQGVRRLHVISRLGKEAGLWTRGSHLRYRDRCLDAFDALFGGLPLRFTTEAYTISDHLGDQLRPVDEAALLSAQGAECSLDTQPGGACRSDCVTCRGGGTIAKSGGTKRSEARRQDDHSQRDDRTQINEEGEGEDG